MNCIQLWSVDLTVEDTQKALDACNKRIYNNRNYGWYETTICAVQSCTVKGDQAVLIEASIDTLGDDNIAALIDWLQKLISMLYTLSQITVSQYMIGLDILKIAGNVKVEENVDASYFPIVHSQSNPEETKLPEIISTLYEPISCTSFIAELESLIDELELKL